MSIDILKSKLAEIEAQKAQLAQEIQQYQQSQKSGFILEIIQKINDFGFVPEEIASAIAPSLVSAEKPAKKKKSAKSDTAPAAVYVSLDNPSRTYARGKMPRWMLEDMAAKGYDASTREGRETYRRDHMQKAA